MTKCKNCNNDKFTCVGFIEKDNKWMYYCTRCGTNLILDKPIKK